MTLQTNDYIPQLGCSWVEKFNHQLDCKTVVFGRFGGSQCSWMNVRRKKVFQKGIT